MIHFQVRHLMGVLECHQLIAVPITTGKKRYCCLSVVTLFQLRPEKKIQLSGHHSLRRSNCHCCAVPITTGKKKIQSSVHCYAIPITTGKKKDTVVWLSFVAPFQLPLLRRSNYDRKKKIQSSVCCYAIPNTTEKKNKNLAGARSLLRPEKKVLVVCLAGAPSLLRLEQKVLVVCLVGARSLLRPEKKF